MRVTLPLTPDHKQLRPEGRDPSGRIRSVSRATSTIDGGPLYFDRQQWENTHDGTSDEIRKQVTEVQRAGSVPPHIAA
eukprot:6066286-Pyramimonas_sp.AAC.1